MLEEHVTDLGSGVSEANLGEVEVDELRGTERAEVQKCDSNIRVVELACPDLQVIRLVDNCGKLMGEKRKKDVNTEGSRGEESS